MKITARYRQDSSKMEIFPVNVYEGSVSWNPGSISDGEEEAKDVTVNGSRLGDFAVASFSLDVQDLILNAQVTSDGTVTCTLYNLTGGAINLSSGTVYVMVLGR